MALKAYNDVILVSPADDRESILALLQDIYATDPTAEFSFLNVYKELPITSSATIFEIKKSSVEFNTNSTQFFTIGEAREVLIQSNLLSTSVIGKVRELDSRRLQVTLGDFSYAVVHSEKRNSVRVRLKLPMQVQLAFDGKLVGGVIRDISLGGVCVTTMLGEVTEQSGEMELRIKLMEAGTGTQLESVIPTRLIRIVENGPHAECAMVFSHTSQSERQMSGFIFQRQVEIIKELKAKA